MASELCYFWRGIIKIGLYPLPSVVQGLVSNFYFVFILYYNEMGREEKIEYYNNLQIFWIISVESIFNCWEKASSNFCKEKQYYTRKFHLLLKYLEKPYPYAFCG